MTWAAVASRGERERFFDEGEREEMFKSTLKSDHDHLFDFQ